MRNSNAISATAPIAAPSIHKLFLMVSTLRRFQQISGNVRLVVPTMPTRGGCREMSFMPLIPPHLPARKEVDYFLLNQLSYDISDSMAFE
jgi:hypothetical protein